MPIDGGEKLNGRVGEMKYWRSRRKDDAQRSVRFGAWREVPGTHPFAGGVSYDVTPNLRPGALLTNGSADGVSRKHSRASSRDGARRLLWAMRTFSWATGRHSVRPEGRTWATGSDGVARSTIPESDGTASHR